MKVSYPKSSYVRRLINEELVKIELYEEKIAKCRFYCGRLTELLVEMEVREASGLPTGVVVDEPECSSALNTASPVP
jgi:hypothetical protein